MAAQVTPPRDLRLLLAGVLAADAWLGWHPALLFVCPGALVLLLPGPGEALAPALVRVVGLSLSFWIVAFWWLRFLPVSLTGLVTGVSVLSAGLWLWAWHRGRQLRVSADRGDAALLLVAALVVVLRLWPMLSLPAPSGTDMSMHTYTAGLIAAADGIPANYHPVMGLDRFSALPVGFPTLTALIAQLGRLPVHRAAFVMTALTYAFLTFALYRLLSRWVPRPAALIAALVHSFVVAVPQTYVAWGGNPTVLALALLIFFVDCLWRLPDEGPAAALLAGLPLAAVLLTHTIVFVQAAYLLGAGVAVWAVLGGLHRDRRWLRLAWPVGVTLLLSLPWLLRYDAALTNAGVREAIRWWVSTTPHAWHGSLADAAWSIPRYILHNTGRAKLLSLVMLGGAIVLYRRQRPLWWFSAVASAVAVLLILNTHYWFLPLSYLIYPERVAATLVIPMALATAFAVTWAGERGGARLPARWSGFLVPGAAALLVLALPTLNRLYLDAMRQENAVTHADVQAFAWIARALPPDAVIANNYGDAGVWLPAILLHPVAAPHVNVALCDKPWQLPPASYVYVGDRAALPRLCQYRAEALLAAPERYELLHREGGACVFRVRGAPLPPVRLSRAAGGPP